VDSGEDGDVGDDGDVNVLLLMSHNTDVSDVAIECAVDVEAIDDERVSGSGIETGVKANSGGVRGRRRMLPCFDERVLEELDGRTGSLDEDVISCAAARGTGGTGSGRGADVEPERFRLRRRNDKGAVSVTFDLEERASCPMWPTSNVAMLRLFLLRRPFLCGGFS
jgi:hypothetical protein